MNTLPVQLPPSVNATAESAPKGRSVDSTDSKSSFHQALKDEVAERRQAESGKPASAANAEKAPTQARTASEKTESTQEKDEPETAASATDTEKMAQYLALTSQFMQPPANPNAVSAEGAAIDVPAEGAVAGIDLAAAGNATAQAAGDAKAESPLPAALAATAASDQAKTSGDTQAGAEKADFAAELGQAKLAQQPGAVQEKTAQDGKNAVEVLAAAAKPTDKTPETQQPQATLTALQQAGIEHLDKQFHPSADRIAPRVATPEWNHAIGQKVIWMAGNEQQSASLSLNPPDLGPLQVVIRVSESMATANFVSAHPEVRQALEAAMPRLREMLGNAGIQLGQAHVGAGNSGEYGARSQQQFSQPMANSVETSFPLQQGPSVSAQVVRRGLVDTFA